LDIGQIPNAGASLRTFFRNYYDFEQTTAELERIVLSRVGSTVAVRFEQGWRIYLKYAILRFAGQSADQVSAGSNFMNYEITWGDAERVYRQLSSDAVISKRFASVFSQNRTFAKDFDTLKKLVPAPR
jgi:hypothetical protein